MLRQIHIFHKGERVFSHTYALGLAKEDLSNVYKIIEDYVENPIPGKTFHKPIGSNYQIFHRGSGVLYFLIITDITDSIDYMDKTLKTLFVKFKERFSDPKAVKEESGNKDEFLEFLKDLQKELHSKIAIAGPVNSGKTTLYNMLKTGEERSLINFARISELSIENLSFDLWDFQLKDNFSLLWSKFLGGADLIIFIFDASNYNLKVINHFLNFEKKEGRFSRFVLIANKIDLVSEDDIKKISNELNNAEFAKLSLTSPKARSNAYQILRNSLGLKRRLPENFEGLLNEAEHLESEKKLVEAMHRYKDLIFICNEYQDYSYIQKFEEKVKLLQQKVEKQVERKKKFDRKRKFKPPTKRTFTTQVSVKTLPKNGVKTEKLPILKEKNAFSGKLRPSDFKINKNLLNHYYKEKSEIKKIQSIPANIKKKQGQEPSNVFKTGSDADKKAKFEVNEANFEEMKKIHGIVKLLMQVIEERGSKLSEELCELYINELKNSLQRELNYDDLELAADFFIKQEAKF